MASHLEAGGPGESVAELCAVGSMSSGTIAVAASEAVRARVAELNELNLRWSDLEADIAWLDDEIERLGRVAKEYDLKRLARAAAALEIADVDARMDAVAAEIEALHRASAREV